MENLFQFIMYKLFGRSWIMHLIREGSRQAIFALYLDLDRLDEKYNIQLENFNEVKERYDAAPKQGLSKEGQKELLTLQEEFENARGLLQNAEMNLEAKRNEVNNAKERLAHVLRVSVSSIENKYAIK